MMAMPMPGKHQVNLRYFLLPAFLTSFHRAGNHRHDGNENGGYGVQKGPNQADLDRSFPFRVLPTQVRQANHGQADAYLKTNFDYKLCQALHCMYYILRHANVR